MTGRGRRTTKARGDDKPEFDERTIQKAADLLEMWAKESSRVLLSIGTSGVTVTGTLHRFDAERFWFKSLGRDITQVVFADPPLTVDERADGKITLRFLGFGPNREERFSLRLSSVQKLPSAELADAVRQLNIWAGRKADLIASFDFGLAVFAHRCGIEKVSDEIYGLTEENGHAHSIVPRFCAFARLETKEGLTMLTLGSERGQFDLTLIEPESAILDPMAFVINKMIH